ncbi:hypothetical protein EGH24_13725 [Halonotius terrestris]|uniref:Uncharacterized protein n=1 Tax=Halonotius terrestris TaxID=2487750 RepID=A0A8J8TAE0_9EURY|nr:hypothetical protein [Halonotius terrestris]TQQ78576.1 hypothetical protein EGH24_13725 [Halonotius terrestris]
MARYECPSCGGGFPNPGPGNECPWCAASLDGSYGDLTLPSDTPAPSLTASTVDIGTNDLTRYCDECGDELDSMIRSVCQGCALDDTRARTDQCCVECGATMENRLQRRCADCAQDAADRSVEPINEKL